MKLETLQRRWHDDAPVIVAAPGESLTEDVALRCRGYRTIVVQDAWRQLPWADILYGCDAAWWRHHDGCRAFRGERWSTHDSGNNDKRQVAESYGVRLVEGRPGETFSTDPAVIHYGHNSGFQAVGMAIPLGPPNIVLVGFDMQGSHFFGDHPKPLHRGAAGKYIRFIRAFSTAAKSLPPGVRIVNATPNSAMTCFPMVPLDEALAGRMAA